MLSKNGEKHFFVYKLFFVIKYFRFYFTLYLNTTTPYEKSNPPLSRQPPSKNWDPVKPSPFLKIW